MATARAPMNSASHCYVKITVEMEQFIIGA